MFNRRTIQNVDNSVNFPDNITVHEHKAPTDESIRLLNEMKEKAMSDLIAEIPVQTNTFNFTTLFFQGHAAQDFIEMYIKFNLNNQDHVIHRKITRYDEHMNMLRRVENIKRMQNTSTHHELMGMLKRAIAEYMTPILLDHFMENKDFFNVLIAPQNGRIGL